MGLLDEDLLDAISQEVRARISEFGGTCTTGDALATDFAMNVTSVLWAFNFAGMLEPDFAEAVRKILLAIGCQVDQARPGSHTGARCTEGQVSGPEVPHVELDLEDMMVVFKPPGWEVDTADVGGARWLSRYVQGLLPWPKRPISFDVSHSYGFLHRLDTLSSGLILTAKTFEAYYHLKFQLSIGSLVRDYVVLCHGAIPPEQNEINARVYHSNVEGNLPSTVCQKGKPSKTYLKVLAHLTREAQDFSLVAIRICTGRRHQIRAHTTHIGHPTVCDGKYTPPAVFLADRIWCERNFLHRYRLAFTDLLHQMHEAMTPLPADLVQALSCLTPRGPCSAAVLSNWLSGQALRDWAQYETLPFVE